VRAWARIRGKPFGKYSGCGEDCDGEEHDVTSVRVRSELRIIDLESGGNIAGATLLTKVALHSLAPQTSGPIRSRAGPPRVLRLCPPPARSSCP